MENNQKDFIYLYKITNLVNQKIYVGIHKTKNIDDGYMGSGLLINRALRKYGKSNFEKSILYFFNTYEEALQKEKQIVNQEFLKRSDIYNLIEGGKGSFYYINRTRDQWDTPEYRKKISTGVKLNKNLPEVRLRRSQIAKELWQRGVYDFHRVQKINIPLSEEEKLELKKRRREWRVEWSKQLNSRPDIKKKKSESLKLNWKSNPNSEDRKDKIRQRISGFKNMEYRDRIPIIESIKDEFLYFCKTNIPDLLIQRFIRFKYSCDLSFDTCLKYLSETYNISILDKDTKYKFHLGKYNQITNKTYICEIVSLILYKNLKTNYLDRWNDFLHFQMNSNVTDSMIYNNLVDKSFGSSYLNYVNYYIYLGLLTGETSFQDINLRNISSISRRKTGRKTIYYINREFVQKYILIKEDNLHAQYTIDFNGSTISYSRI